MNSAVNQELNSNRQRLLAANAQFKYWIINRALPLWDALGFDRHNGCFYERINDSAEAQTQLNKRVRVQARQQFVYAFAYARGWYPQGREICNRLGVFLAEKGKQSADDELYAHLLDNNNQIIDARHDLYDTAFHLLAAAAQYHAFQDVEHLHRAEAIFTCMDKTLNGAQGGWLEGNYSSDVRRQNPHMHLFEAFMALYEASSATIWLARAEQIFKLFERYFYLPEQGVLLEFFASDWARLNTPQGEVIEPGHLMEWVWLLRKYQSLSSVSVDNYCDQLYSSALKLGQNSVTGLLYDELSIGQGDRLESHRSWILTEYLKASVAQAKVGQSEYEAHAALAVELLFKYYISAVPQGLYIDRVNRSGEPIDAYAPASTLYHFILAAAELDDYCKALSER